MAITCCDIPAYLNALPPSWNADLTALLCKILAQQNTFGCDTVKECETLTRISDLTLTDGVLAFTYFDENEQGNSKSIDLSALTTGSYTFRNGLNEVSPGIVELGVNPLLHNTTLTTAGYEFHITGTKTFLDGRTSAQDDTGEFTPVNFLYTDTQGKILSAPLSEIVTIDAIADFFQNDLGLNPGTSKIEQGFDLSRDTTTSLEDYYREWIDDNGENILKLYPSGNIDFGYSGTTTIPFEHYRMTSSAESIPAAWLDSGAVTVTRYNKIDYNNGAAGTSNLRMRWFDQGVSGNSSFSFISGSQSNATTFTRNSTMRIWGGIGVGTTPLSGIYVEGYNAATGGASDAWTPFSAVNVGGVIQPMNDTARQFYGYNLTTDFNQPDIGAFTNPTINITGLNVVPTLTENGTVNLIGVNFAPNISANPTVASDYKFLSSTRGKVIFGNADFLGYIRPHRATTTQITNVKNTLGTAGTAELLGGEIIYDITSEELKFYKISIDDFVAV